MQPRLALALAFLFSLSPALARADATAQLVGSSIVLSRPLAFDSHHGGLDPADGPLLDALASLIRAHPTMTIEIGAHTDARGGDDYNLRFTQSVADQVRMALVSRGVTATRIRAVGYGETRPIADNMTAAGRAANRRIEILVVHP